MRYIFVTKMEVDMKSPSFRAGLVVFAALIPAAGLLALASVRAQTCNTNSCPMQWAPITACPYTPSGPTSCTNPDGSCNSLFIDTEDTPGNFGWTCAPSFIAPCGCPVRFGCTRLNHSCGCYCYLNCQSAPGGGCETVPCPGNCFILFNVEYYSPCFASYPCCCS